MEDVEGIYSVVTPEIPTFPLTVRERVLQYEKRQSQSSLPPPLSSSHRIVSSSMRVLSQVVTPSSLASPSQLDRLRRHATEQKRRRDTRQESDFTLWVREYAEWWETEGKFLPEIEEEDDEGEEEDYERQEEDDENDSEDEGFIF